MRPEVSILLPSWNTCTLTLACLDALPAAAAGLAYETVVVDNGSRDGSARALAQRDGLLLLANASNRGYAAAINQAYAQAAGEYVLLLNSDVRLAPGALAALVRFLRDRADAAGVAPCFRNPDGSFQHHYYQLPSLAVALGLASGLRRLPFVARRLRAYRMLDEDFARPRPVPLPSASCLLLRRSLLEPGPLLDEAYPIYFNDVALARSLGARGRTLWMTPAAVAIHDLGASTGQLGAALARQHLGSLSCWVAASEPRAGVELFRLLVLTDWLARRLLRRPQPLAFTELRDALRGDPGALPAGPPPAQ